MSKKGIWIDRNTFVAFSEGKTTRPLSEEIATRDRSIDFYSLGMYLPNPDTVLKKTGKDIKVYKELTVDSHLGGCITSRKAGVKSLEWEIDRGQSKSRQAKLITDLFKDIDLDRIIGEILDAPLYGYQFMEVLWARIGSYWLPKDVVGKPQHWFNFRAEDNSPRLLTRGDMINGEPLPPRKFLIPRHEATYENPYGFPVLSRCFWPVTFKKGGFKFWVKFAEKFGMPFLWGKLPRGLAKAEYDSLADILEEMVQDAIGVTPDDASIEMLTTEGKASGDIYNKLIEACKTEISIAVLGQNLTTEVKGGSYAAAESHMTVRKDIADSDKKIVEGALNKLIGWIYELNFGGGDRPTFGMWEEEDVDKDQADRDKTLADTGQIKFTTKYFMKTYGFEEEDIVVNEEMPDNSPLPSLNLREDKGALSFSEPSPSRGEGKGEGEQAALDAAIEKIDPAVLQKQMEGVLKPVINLVESGKSYEDILGMLADVFPAMKADVLQEMLARAIFVSELWGRVNAKS